MDLKANNIFCQQPFLSSLEFWRHQKESIFSCFQPYYANIIDALIHILYIF